MTEHHPNPSALPRRLWAASTAAATALCIAAAPAAMAQEDAAERPTRDVTFMSAEGEEIGTGTLTATPKGLLVDVEVSGLPADSWLGFHVHEQGVCDAEGGFKSAGDHFNPTNANHGLMAEGGAHAGDMPNQYVPADGVLKTQVLNSAVSIGGGDTDVSGRAIVIHGGSDDYESQPSGDAGDRIACAVIK